MIDPALETARGRSPGVRRFSGGEVATTVSGRQTSPFPMVDVTTDRRTANTLRRLEEWLLAEARTELGDREFLLAGETPGKLPHATIDMCNMVLFG